MIYDILILGAGWTSTFLIPLLQDEKKKYAATTTTGRESTIKWSFDPAASTSDSYKTLPEAATILVTFPLTGKGQSHKLVQFYHETHKSRPHFIQLGSTGIWQSGATPDRELWITRHSHYDTHNPRAVAEDELKSLGGVILNLSGLWGGARQPATFVSRIFKSRRDVAEKTSLHMVHGRDVARAIYAVMQDWPGASRWMLTDGFVYDWWSLLAGWGSGHSSAANHANHATSATQHAVTEATKGGKGAAGDEDAEGKVLDWVRECMQEKNVRALPRSMEMLGRCYDSREFWETFKLTPVRARI